MNRGWLRKWNFYSQKVAAVAVLHIFAHSCAKAENEPLSLPQTVDLPQSEVKSQVIGNCWAYSLLGWAESLILKGSEGTRTENLSETFLTYKQMEDQLSNDRWITEVIPIANWSHSVALVKKYGLMREVDFLPSEALSNQSGVQKTALEKINKSLKDGRLSYDLSQSAIRDELDAAFGVKMAELQAKVFWPKDVILEQGADGENFTLEDHLNQWRYIPWAAEDSAAPGLESLPAKPDKVSPLRRAIIKRVKDALNAGWPVIMNWFVDGNGYDAAQRQYTYGSLRLKGLGSKQGYHTVVLEDYTVKGIDPRTGKPFEIGEGLVDEEKKWLAAEYGDLEYFVIKNSWGSGAGPDSYNRNGEWGYHRIGADYLYTWMSTMGEGDDGNPKRVLVTGVTGFILPPGF